MLLEAKSIAFKIEFTTHWNSVIYRNAKEDIIVRWSKS